MQSSVWKLFAVAGVIGVGCLVVFKAQQGLTQQPGRTPIAGFQPLHQESPAPNAAETLTVATGAPSAVPVTASPQQLAPQSGTPGRQEPTQVLPTSAEENSRVTPLERRDLAANPFDLPEASSQPPARAQAPTASDDDPADANRFNDAPRPQLNVAAQSPADDPFGPAPAAESSPAPVQQPQRLAADQAPKLEPIPEPIMPLLAEDDPAVLTAGATAEASARNRMAGPVQTVAGEDAAGFDDQPFIPDLPRPAPADAAESSPFGVQPPVDAAEPAPAPEPDDNPFGFGPEPASVRSTPDFSGDDPFGPAPPIEDADGADPFSASAPRSSQNGEVAETAPAKGSAADLPSNAGASGGIEVEFDINLPLPDDSAATSSADVPAGGAFANDSPESAGPQGDFGEDAAAPAQSAAIPRPNPANMEPPIELDGTDGFEFADEPAAPTEPRPAAASPQAGDALKGDGVVDRQVSAGQQPQLTIEKVAPPRAVLGEEMIYSIIVRNAGDSTAHDVVVEDRIPRGTRLLGTIPQGALVGKRLLFELGSIAAGQQEEVKIKVVPESAGEVGSIATVSFAAEVAAQTVVTAPELKMELTGPEEMQMGEQAIWQFTISNVGSERASEIFIRNLLPEGLHHPGGSDLEYDFGALEAEETRSVELPLTAVRTGEFLNRATVTAKGGVSTDASAAVRIIESRLSIERTGPAKRFVGRESEFVNTVTNHSSQPLQDVRVVETLPEGIAFVSAADGGIHKPPQSIVEWVIPSLEPGESRPLHVMLTPTQAGQLESRVEVADGANNHAEATAQLEVAGFSALELDLAHDGRPIAVGEQVSLRFHVTNGGTAAATNVETVFELPEQVDFVSAKGPTDFVREGRVIRFTPMRQVGVESDHQFDIVLTAAKAGNAHVQVNLISDQLSRPLIQAESIVIFDDVSN